MEQVNTQRDWGRDAARPLCAVHQLFCVHAQSIYSAPAAVVQERWILSL
jgi:hypothetical protein